MLGWKDEAYYRSELWRGTWKVEGGECLSILILLFFNSQPVQIFISNGMIRYLSIIG